MNLISRVALCSGLTVSVLLGAMVSIAQAFEIQRATFVGQQTISNDAPIAGTPATTLNGLSGLTYGTNDTYYVVSDNAPAGNAKFHTLTIKIQGNAVQVTPVSTTYLKRADGTGISAQDLDNEGVAVTRDGKLWISSEGYVTRNPTIHPTINQFSLQTGQQLTSLPIDAKFKATFNA
jgi:uncharacterized protein YjiK